MTHAERLLRAAEFLLRRGSPLPLDFETALLGYGFDVDRLRQFHLK